ncbi:MAG: type 4a pilus biogenesis protein PilO [bacterium]
MKSITPILFVIISVVLFFTVTDPVYKRVKDLQVKYAQYQDVLDKSTELLKQRKALQDKYDSFSKEDLDKLNKLLPDTVDNVRLIIDMDGIAKRYGLVIKNVRLDTSTPNASGKKDSISTITAGEAKYGTIPMGFSVTADYNTFLTFLEDLESSLRIVDVTNISLTPGANNIYSFDVSLKTYWLK